MIMMVLIFVSPLIKLTDPKLISAVFVIFVCWDAVVLRSLVSLLKELLMINKAGIVLFPLITNNEVILRNEVMLLRRRFL